MICRKCGVTLNGNIMNCLNCGYPVEQNFSNTNQQYMNAQMNNQNNNIQQNQINGYMNSQNVKGVNNSSVINSGYTNNYNGAVGQNGMNMSTSNVSNMDGYNQYQTINNQNTVFSQNTFSIENNNDLNHSNNIGQSNKSKKGVLVIILLIVALLGGLGCYFFIFNKDNSNNNEVINKDVISGIYYDINGDSKLYVYQLNEDEIYFYSKIGIGNSSSKLDIEGNVATDGWSERYRLTFLSGQIKYEDIEDNETIIFDKNKEYALKEYYSDFYGDANYLTTQFNGEFKNDNTTIKIFQIDEAEVRFEMTSINGGSVLTSSYVMEIKNNELTYESDSFGDIKKTNIKFVGDKLIFNFTSTDVENKMNELSGEYSKTKSYTMNDIINEFSFVKFAPTNDR